MKVIIKKPEEKYGVITDIKNDLDVLHDIVGGFIEVVPFDKCLIICNENGKILNLAPNIRYEYDYIVGTIVVCGRDEDDFTDIPISMEEWKKILSHN